MQTSLKTNLALATLAALGLAAAPAARAQDTGTLSGAFYNAPAASINNIAQAQAYIAANTPTGAFTASQGGLGGGYSGYDTTLVQAFLGADGASYSGANVNLADGVFDLKGYIDATFAGTYSFSTSSDDGSALYIDGSEIVNNDGVHGNSGVSNTDALSAGNHSVEIVYFNKSAGGGGGANLAAGFDQTALTTNPTPGSTPEDVFAPGDAITAVAVNSTNPNHPNEPNEGVANAVDHNTADKYLNFAGAGSGFIDTPQRGAGLGGTIVTGLQLSTGNDEPSRNPLTYVLEGSNDGGVTFTQIATGSTGLDSDPGRNTFGLRESFANAAAYTTYEIYFPSLRDNNSNIMQVGEVELFGTPAPEPSQFAGLGVGLLGLAGLAFKARKRTA